MGIRIGVHLGPAAARGRRRIWIERVVQEGHLKQVVHRQRLVTGIVCPRLPASAQLVRVVHLW